MDTQTRMTPVLERTLLEAIPTGMMLVDRSGHIVQANQRLLDTFGWEVCPDLWHLNDLLPPQYRSHHVRLLDGFWKDPQARLMGDGRDLTALHRQGHEFPVEIGLVPWPEQAPIGALVSVVDITLRKQRELALSQAITELDEFTRVVSHDLRSPVLGLGHLCQWIKDDLAAGEMELVNDHLSKASDRILKMQGLVEDLLVYARAGHQNDQFESVDLKKTVAEVWSLMKPESDFTLTVHCDSAIWTTARVPLETVLRNLIGNAIKHHHTGCGHIDVRFCDKPNEGRVSVSDDGPGIPNVATARVSQLFQTLADRKPKGSTGIGLAVCRRLVESMGGQLTLSDNLPAGVCIEFGWPRVDRIDYNRAHSRPAV